MNNQAGKGDRYRPVDSAVYAANYDAIFGVTDETWIVCPQHKRGYNSRNPCPECVKELTDVSVDCGQ